MHYFGKQRGCGGRNEHPSLHQCIKNYPALCMQKSFVLDSVRGNCRRKRLLTELKVDDTPLPKRQRLRSQKLFIFTKIKKLMILFRKLTIFCTIFFCFCLYTSTQVATIENPLIVSCYH